MKVVAFPTYSGSRYWRLEDPFYFLRKMGVDAQIYEEGINEQIAKEADIFVLQGCVDRDGIALLYEMQQTKGKKIVVDTDDFPWLNADNPHLIEHKIALAPEVIQRTMEIADLVTTTTNHLAEKLRKINDHVAVLPNYLNLGRWDLQKLKNTSKTIRIGWAGSITHMNDLRLLVNPLKRICAEFPQVQLISVGDLRTKQLFEGLPIEVMTGVEFEAWPQRLHGLRLDIGLSPLLPNEFNKCKSNIKWLEYSIAGIPGVYSPTVYQNRHFEPKFGQIATTEDQWYNAIKNYIISPALREDVSEGCHRLMRVNYNLAKHAFKWKEAYESLLI